MPQNAAASSASSVSVQLSSSAASAFTEYTVTFTISSALAAGQSITLVAPPGTQFQGNYYNVGVADLTNSARGGDYPGTGSSGSSATVLLGGSPAAGDTLVVTIPAVNPTTTSSADTLQVSTSSDTTPFSSNAYAITPAQSVSNVSLAISSSAASALAEYTVTFTLSSTGALTVKGGGPDTQSSITLVAPPGTQFQGTYYNVGVADLTDSARGGDYPGTGSSGNSATVVLGGSPAAGDTLVVTIPAVNPNTTAPGETLQVSTSSDTVTASTPDNTVMPMPAGIAGTIDEVLNGQNEGGVSGAGVEACPTAGGSCTIQPGDSSSTGDFSIGVVPGTYTLTVLPPASLAGFGPVTSGPLTVTTGQITNITVDLSGGSLPPGATLTSPTSFPKTFTPTIFWGAPSVYTVAGCKGGFGELNIQGTNAQTGQPSTDAVSLTETPPGSGNYVANIPPLLPVHGTASVSQWISCPGKAPVLPNGGTPAGGTTVLVSGLGLDGATAVTFGTVPATSFTVLDANLISAVSPAGTGTVDVSVATSSAKQIEGQFSYMSVTGLGTTSGPSAGGTTVAIFGTGFTNVGGVLFGDSIIPASQVTVVSSTELEVTSPAQIPGGNGSATVSVLTSHGGATLTSSASTYAYSTPASPPQSTQNFCSESPNNVLCLAFSAAGWSFSWAKKACDQNPLNATCTYLTGNYGENAADWITGPIAVVAALVPLIGRVELTDLAAPFLQSLIGLVFGPGTTGLEGDALVGALSPIWTTLLPEAALGIAACIASVVCGVTAAVVLGVIVGVIVWKLFIDPGGTVVDTTGNPISGATATILTQGSPGTFSSVDPSSGAIDPATNPETTGSSGVFDWEALAGTYQVQASAPGCYAPGSPTQSSVTTPALVLPPPAIGLFLTLQCPGSSPPTPVVTELSSQFGPAAGGNVVDVSGTGLDNATAVDFGGVPGTDVTVLSPYAVSAIAPPGISTVDITVTTPGGTSATSSADQYSYVSFPANDTDLALAGVPAPITVSATGPTGATVSFTAPTAVDEETPPTVGCDHSSGSIFPIGTTTVTCTASDADDTPATVSRSFTVTVNDTDLALTGVPGNITINATSPKGAVATYTAPTAVDEEGAPAVSCDHASGATYAIGTTTVTCTASDADDTPATVSRSFTVTVRGAAAQVTIITNQVAGLTSAAPIKDLLLALLRAAQTEVSRGLSRAACATMGVFTIVVRVLERVPPPFGIAPAQANVMIAEALQVRATLGC